MPSWAHKAYVPKGDPVWGEGPQPCRLMIVGERPGKDEDRLGRPFVGLSGQELERYLSSIDVDRAECYVTNLVKTFGEAPTVAEIEQWQDILMDELNACKPDVIAAVGAHAAEFLLGPLYTAMDELHGIPIRSWAGLTVPIMHPASAFYDAEAGKYIQYDFQILGGVLTGDVLPRQDLCPDAVYGEVTDISPFQMSAAGDVIAIDTEGSRRLPWCLSYSTEPGEALAIRAGVPALEKFRSIIPRFPQILLHNSLHDLEVMATLGCPIRDGQFIDTMVLAYLLCVEPQGLKPLAYRYAGMKMSSYSDIIAEADSALAEEYLLGLEALDLPEWEEEALIIKYVDGQQVASVSRPWGLGRHVRYLLRDFREKAGVNLRKRWNNIDDWKKSAVVASVGDMPEATLDDIPQKKAIDYACRDADATLRIYPHLRRRVEETGQWKVAEIDHSIIPMVDRMQRTGFGVSLDYFRALESECDEKLINIRQEIKSLTGSWINPNSGDQVADLLDTQTSIVLEKKTKGDKRYATNDKVLKAICDQHPVVPLIMDYREVAKVRDSFCRAIPRFVGPDNRVHCNMRITRVSSGRLSATGPNLLAIPVRTELGKRVRAGFVPADGRIIATWDLNQIEMRHMAAESGDPALCSVYERDEDVHTDTTERLRTDRPMAKRINFGIITGITGYGLLDQVRLAWADWPAEKKAELNEERCDELIEQWLGAYRGVRAYMDQCRAEACRFGFVRDCWGRIRYLPGAHSPIERIRKEALRQSHSHKIQAGAQGIMKVAMAHIWRECLPALWDAGFWIEPLLQIHDELVFELDPACWELADCLFTEALTTAHLEHFPEYRVPLKAKGVFGANWGALEK